MANQPRNKVGNGVQYSEVDPSRGSPLPQECHNSFFKSLLLRLDQDDKSRHCLIWGSMSLAACSHVAVVYVAVVCCRERVAGKWDRRRRASARVEACVES